MSLSSWGIFPVPTVSNQPIHESSFIQILTSKGMYNGNQNENIYTVVCYSNKVFLGC